MQNLLSGAIKSLLTLLVFLFFGNSPVNAQESLKTFTHEGQQLQVYPTDHSTRVPWGPPNDASGATSLNDGSTNSQTVVGKYGNWYQGNYAAKACADLNAFGYSDWYLPSRGELKSLYSHGFTSGTDMSYIAIKIPAGASRLPMPGSIVHVFRETKNLDEIGRDWRLQVSHTPWERKATAKFVEIHSLELISGDYHNYNQTVYDKSIFSLHFDAKVYQGVLIDFSSVPQILQQPEITRVKDSGTFTDTRDGQTYRWVRIGDQVWMAENLNYATRSGSWYYDIRSVNCNYYGRLYNWETAMKTCPTGWHLPCNQEWEQLIKYLSDEHGIPNTNTLNGAGNALKSCCQVNSPLGGECLTSKHPRWDSFYRHGTDLFGFSALPGGYRCTTDGLFHDIGQQSLWWSTTEVSSEIVWGAGINVGAIDLGNCYKGCGFSVRCVHD